MDSSAWAVTSPHVDANSAMQPKTPINLAFLRRTNDNRPHLLDDIVTSVLEILQRIGTTVAVSFNKIAPDALNIVVGAGMPGTPSLSELRSFTRPDNTIIFNTEQLGSNSVLITEEYLQLLADYVVWDYCQDNIEVLRQRVGTRLRCHEFPILPPESFGLQLSQLAQNQRYDFDVAFYGAIDVPRRRDALRVLHHSGLSVKLIQGAFGDGLSRQLQNCRLVINLHAYETGLLEIGRCLRPMAMGIPIVSETSRFPVCVDWENSGIVFSPLSDLPDHCRALTRDVRLQQQAQRKMLHFMYSAKWPTLARQILEKSLSQLQGYS